LNWLDIVILVLLALATLGGLFIGLIRAVISLAGIVLAVVLAGRLYLPFSRVLSFLPESAARAVAYILILVLVLLIAGMVAWLLTKAVAAIKLGWADRLGGALAGIFFGTLLCGALLAIWAKLAGSSAAISGSVLASFLLDQFPLVLGLLPREFDGVRAFFR